MKPSYITELINDCANSGDAYHCDEILEEVKRLQTALKSILNTPPICGIERMRQIARDALGGQGE